MIFYFIVKMLGIFEMRKLVPKNYDEKEFDSLTNKKSRIKDDIVNIKKKYVYTPIYILEFKYDIPNKEKSNDKLFIENPNK